MYVYQQLTNNIQLKKHSTITILGAILGFSIVYFFITGDTFNNDVSLSSAQVILGAIIGIVSAYGFYFSANFLDRALPWHKLEGNRLLSGILVHYILIFVISISLLYLGSLFYSELDFQVIQEQYLLKLGIILFFLILIIEIIYFALYSYYSYTSFQIENVRQERKQIELQLKALKSQLSPHFLFNSLNTVSSLVFKDKNKAEGFIRRLAKMYQYTIDSYQKKMSSLREELEFVESYQYLIETRFGNKIHCDIKVNEEHLETRIPPLTLQMLLENAVKHNVLSEENPLNIEVRSEGEYLVVVNNITQKPKKVTSFKIGLKNINARYLLLHKEGITVTNGENFQVKVPIIV